MLAQEVKKKRFSCRKQQSEEKTRVDPSTKGHRKQQSELNMHMENVLVEHVHNIHQALQFHKKTSGRKKIKTHM